MRATIGVVVMLIVCVLLGVQAVAAGTNPADACKNAKAKAAGKKAADLLKAFGKNVKKVDPTKLSAGVSKAQSKLTKAFTKAESRGGCETTGDATVIEAKVDAFAADVLAEVTDVGSSTTTTPSTTTTSSSSTTSTTLDPNAPVCCETGGDPPVCYAGLNSNACAAFPGTPVPGAVCDGAGHCVSPPGTPGCCCQIPGPYCGGTDLDEAGCSSSNCGDLGGIVLFGSVCQTDGTCQF